MGVSTGVLAQPSSPAALFGAREGVEGVALSPDGDKVAFLAPSKGQGNILYTVDLTTGGAPKVALFANGDPERILKCQWVSNLRLTCDLRGRMNWSGQISFREASPAQNAAKIKAPVLLFHGDVDTNVGVQHSRDMAGKLKEAGQSVRLIEFPDADHQLNDADIRTRLLQESLDFIDGALRRRSEKKEI